MGDAWVTARVPQRAFGRIDAIATWQAATPDRLTGRTVVVIDVLRWSTVVVTALANGAERVEAFADPDSARARAAALGRDRSVLGGERHNRALEGFDVGNSPLEYTRDRVAGRTVVTSTTNGTSALVAARGGERVLVAAFANLGATVAALATALRTGQALTLLSAGQAGAETLEDTCCAGALVDALLASRAVADSDISAGARRARDAWVFHQRSTAEVMLASRHAAALRDDGFEGDVLAAGRLDTARFAVSASHTGRHAEIPSVMVMPDT